MYVHRDQRQKLPSRFIHCHAFINIQQPPPTTTTLFHAIQKVLPQGQNPLVSGITQIFSMNFQMAGTQYKGEEQVLHFDLIFIHLLARAVCYMRLFLILGANSEIVQSLQPMSDGVIIPFSILLLISMKTVKPQGWNNLKQAPFPLIKEEQIPCIDPSLNAR